MIMIKLKISLLILALLVIYRVGTSQTTLEEVFRVTMGDAD